MKPAHDTSHTEARLFISRMITLEKSVQALMEKATGPLCAGCKKVCCQPEICRESLDSAFLCRVRQHADMPDFSPDTGWLCEFGCTLEAGRPPVCYEYFCDHIMTQIPDRDQRWRMLVLGHLVSHAGKRALNDKHIVELTNRELAAVAWPRMNRRMQEALEALAALEFHDRFQRNGPAGIQAMTRIIPVRS